MPKRVFRARGQIFLSMLTRNLPQEREEEFEHDDKQTARKRRMRLEKAWNGSSAGQVYCLNGDLGVGKTVLPRVCRGTWKNSGTGQQPDLHDRAGVRRWAPAALPF